MKNILILIGIALQASTLCFSQHSTNKYQEHLFCKRKYTSVDLFKSDGVHKKEKTQPVATAQLKLTEGFVHSKNKIVLTTAGNALFTSMAAKPGNTEQFLETANSQGQMALASEPLSELERLEREYLKMHKIIVKKLAANELL